MKIVNAEISTCRLYKSDGWYWWDISLLFEDGTGTSIVKTISDGSITNVVRPSVAMMLNLMTITESYCLEEIQGKYVRVEFDDSEKIVRMMHIIKPYELIFSDYDG